VCVCVCVCMCTCVRERIGYISVQWQSVAGYTHSFHTKMHVFRTKNACMRVCVPVCVYVCVCSCVCVYVCERQCVCLSGPRIHVGVHVSFEDSRTDCS